MKKLPLLVAICFLSIKLHAVIEVGQDVPNQCWKDVNEKQVCLEDTDVKGTVRVLMYSTGWCPGCNEEMQELAPRSKEFAGKPVTFISLSVEGDDHGAPPDTAFLMEWQQRYQIPFAVAASPKDPGKSFFNSPYYIPALVLIGKDQKLAYKEIAPSVDDLFVEINKALK